MSGLEYVNPMDSMYQTQNVLMRGQQMKAQNQDDALQQTRNALYQQTGGDPVAMQRALTEQGDMQGAMEFAKMNGGAQKAQQDAKLGDLEYRQKAHAYIGDKVYNSTPEQWDGILAEASQILPDEASNLPRKWSPEVAKHYGEASMTFAQKEAMQQKREESQMRFDDRAESRADRQSSRQENSVFRQQSLDMQREALDLKRGASGSVKLPVAALKLQNEAVEDIGLLGGLNSDIGSLVGDIESGKLEFGPASNLYNAGKNMLGIGDEKSRKFDDFKTKMEKMRNDSLRLNKGVQTEGDAVRAWNEIFKNINDTELVKERLKQVSASNERAALLKQNSVDIIRKNYGADDLEAPYQQPSVFGNRQPQSTPQQAAPQTAPQNTPTMSGW